MDISDVFIGARVVVRLRKSESYSADTYRRWEGKTGTVVARDGGGAPRVRFDDPDDTQKPETKFLAGDLQLIVSSPPHFTSVAEAEEWLEAHSS